MPGQLSGVTFNHHITIFYKELLDNIYKLHNLFTFINTSKSNIIKFTEIGERFDTNDFFENLRRENVIEAEAAGQIYVDLPEINIRDLEQFELRSKLLLLFVYFENYFYQTLNHILITKPSILTSRKIEINIDKFVNTEKSVILQQKIDKIIEDMMRGSISHLFKELSALNIKHNITEEHIERLYKYFQIRNIFTHNNGKVNTIFKNRISTNLEIGDMYPLTMIETNKILTDLQYIAEEIDISLMDQFSWLPLYIAK